MEVSSGARQSLLSIGALLIIIVVSVLLYQPLQLISDWMLIWPLIVALFGCWIIALSGIRASHPQKYERGAFSTLSWGLLLAALGGAWFMYGYGFNWIYSLIIVVLVVAVLAIATALKWK